MTTNVLAFLLLIFGCCAVAASIVRVLRAESGKLGKMPDGVTGGI